MKSKYDVVIIGAGPAGLKCADTLGNTNLEVLILEKNKVVGPKVCAGGLTYLAKDFNLPEEKSREFSKQYITLNGKEYSFNLTNPLKTISRYDLGQYQLSQLDKFNNIEFQKEKLVSKINQDSIELSGGKKIKFNYLVGADGASSIVRKNLNLPSKFNVGYQYIIPETSEKFIWFLEPKKIASGYAWIFPHKQFTSAGIYFNPKIIDSKKAKNSLNEILLREGVNFSNAKFERSPTNTLYVGNKFGNRFLAGESSGLVSANTGEGISYGLINGEDVAKNILGEGNFEKTKEILKFKKRQETFLKAFDILNFPSIQTGMFKVFAQLLKNEKFQEWYGN